MPNYETSGTENLRADPSVKHVDGDRSPGGGGTDAGGTDSPRVTTQVKQGKSNDWNPPQRSVDIPKGVQHFDDDMGRKN